MQRKSAMMLLAAMVLLSDGGLVRLSSAARSAAPEAGSRHDPITDASIDQGAWQALEQCSTRHSSGGMAPGQPATCAVLSLCQLCALQGPPLPFTPTLHAPAPACTAALDTFLEAVAGAYDLSPLMQAPEELQVGPASCHHTVPPQSVLARHQAHPPHHIRPASPASPRAAVQAGRAAEEGGGGGRPRGRGAAG